MSPKQRQTKPQSREGAASDTPRGNGRSEAQRSSQAKSEHRIRSVLIEPRHNEPPRVSVSVEYKGRAPGVQALQKAAMEVCHSVVSRASVQTFVDLGYRAHQTQRTLVQSFELREKESK